MKTRFLIAGLTGLSALAACRSSDLARPAISGPAFRVINGFPGPVDVLVDGSLSAASVAAGALDTVAGSAGAHTVQLRPAGTSTPVSIGVTTAAGTMPTLAAIRVNGALNVSDLADTNAIVPSGATKVRVLHLAPNAGEIQVFRTQPDYGTPVEWQFPFLYDSVITALNNPYIQSTVGTWDIRAWRKPSEVSLGWDGTAARATISLASGQKATVVVLDKPGGGIQLSVIE